MYHKWHSLQSYDVLFLRYGVQRTEFFVILDLFLLFYSSNSTKNYNFEKMKKMLGDIIILHIDTKNDQSSNVWFLRYWAQRTEFFVILEYFLPFYPLNNLKNQTFEKMKKIPGDIIILHKCTINYNHMMYGSWDMKCDGQNFVLFWTAFCRFTPLATWKIKILKNWKKLMEISSFNTLYCSWNMAHDGCNYFSFWATFLPIYSPHNPKNEV